MSTFEQKCNNGVFDYSPYSTLIKNEFDLLSKNISNIENLQIKREIELFHYKIINKLSEKFSKDEFNRLESLKKNLRKYFKGTEDQVNYFLENIAQGVINELPNQYKKWLLTQNKLINCILNNF